MKLLNILCLLYAPFHVSLHCLLDMRLNYEEAMDNAVDSMKMYPKTMGLIHKQVTENPYISPTYDLFRGTTLNFNNQLYLVKIQQKLEDIMQATLLILNKFCTFAQFEPVLGESVDIKEDYDHYLGAININGDEVEYSNSGRYRVLVKKMLFKNFECFSIHQNRDIFLSRASK